MLSCLLAVNVQKINIKYGLFCYSSSLAAYFGGKEVKLRKEQIKEGIYEGMKAERTNLKKGRKAVEVRKRQRKLGNW